MSSPLPVSYSEEPWRVRQDKPRVGSGQSTTLWPGSSWLYEVYRGEIPGGGLTWVTAEKKA